MLLYNNLLALPLMVAYMVVGTREVQEIRYFPQLDDPLFLVSCPAPPAAAQPVQPDWLGDQKHVSVIDRPHGG